MSAEDIPEAVKRFVDEHVSSVAELELLILLREGSTRAWSAHEVAQALRVEAMWAARTLDRLVAKGILVSEESQATRYRLAPASPEHLGALDELARCYAQRGVSIVTLIYSKPREHILSFANAFRLRDDK